MYETKAEAIGADPLEASFDAVAAEAAVGELRAEMAGLSEGCDRTLATCRDRFSNAVNFRGEPYLPGNDLLTSYPGA